VKRIAAILVLGGALAVGVSSQATAAGDPLYVDQCVKLACAPVLSVGQLAGSQVGDLVCTPSSQISLPPIAVPSDPSGFPSPTYFRVVICKQ
jgi:hypothetical protein